MALERFDPPGFAEDLDDEGKKEWSRWISDEMDRARARDGKDEGAVNFGPRPQFFNPLKNPPAADAVEKDIEWPAFPRVLEIDPDLISDVQRWRRADSSRDLQDEYCEWSVTRDTATGKIVRVTFTSEGPEYWRFLAAVDPNRVVALYREHVDPRVQRADLFAANGTYRPRNRWNNSTENGAMHLIQEANNLGAEIELAAGASVPRERAGQLLVTAGELIECGRYGVPDRHSDPRIGAEVNELARKKADITLSNPVGLYLAGLSVEGWKTPDDSDPKDYWKITRGTREKTLRAVYEVPKGKNFVVGDITIRGRKIELGAQIVQFIKVKLTGVATRIGQSRAKPLGCVAFGASPFEAKKKVVSVEEALGRRPSTRG